MRARALAFTLPFLIGCAGSEAALRARAARDLDCPEAQIEILPRSETAGNRIVRGCGLAQSYESRCFACEWELDMGPK
jgi:hypothetical protein